MEIDINTALVPFTSLNMQNFVESYGNISVFIGAFLFGEFAVLTAFILATQGVFSSSTIFIVSVIGIACADACWYGFGFYFSKKKPGWHLHDQSIIAKTATFWERIIGKNIFISLLVVKFLYGIRWATIVFLGLKRLAIPFFLVFDLLGIIVFVGVLFVIGWITGKGIYNLIPFYHGVIGIIIAIIFAIIVVNILHLVFHKKIKGSKNAHFLKL